MLMAISDDIDVLARAITGAEVVVIVRSKNPHTGRWRAGLKLFVERQEILYDNDPLWRDTPEEAEAILRDGLRSMAQLRMQSIADALRLTAGSG